MLEEAARRGSAAETVQLAVHRVSLDVTPLRHLPGDACAESAVRVRQMRRRNANEDRMTWGSARKHQRTSQIIPKEMKKRGKCSMRGCNNRCTHFGRANGVALTAGCQFHMAMWVRDGRLPR